MSCFACQGCSRLPERSISTLETLGTRWFQSEIALPQTRSTYTSCLLSVYGFQVGTHCRIVSASRRNEQWAGSYDTGGSPRVAPHVSKNMYQDPPTGCLETLTGGLWTPVVTRRHLLDPFGGCWYTNNMVKQNNVHFPWPGTVISVRLRST